MKIQTLRNKIQKLEAVAQAIRVDERPIAIQAVEQIIADYRLTDKDVHLPSHLKGVHIPAKYKHPNTGQSWSGRGVQPKWIRDWLSRGNHLDCLTLDSQGEQA